MGTGRPWVSPPLVHKVARLVRMTVPHDPIRGDRSAEVLSDADLSALAFAAEDYRRNTAGKPSPGRT